MYRTFRIVAIVALLLLLLVLVPSPKFVFAEIIEYPLDQLVCQEPYADCYTDEWHYEDPSISVSIEKGRWEDTTNYMVVRVKIANASQLRTAFITDNYWNPDSKPAEWKAKRVNAVVAINGDYYTEPKRLPYGFMARQGRVYRTKNTYYDNGLYFDVLVIDDQGDFHIEQAKTAKYFKEELPYTPIQAFTFGPGLIIDGVLQENLKNLDYGATSHFQRMAIAQCGPLEYMCICCEGPEDEDGAGMDINQFAQLCYSFEGIQNCYNLDGGSSTTVVFRNEKVNSPNNPKHRPIPDIIYFATAYIPDATEE